MRMLLAGTLKRFVLTAHNLVSQVIVSVAAAICVALITNTYFDKPVPAPAETTGVVAAPTRITAEKAAAEPAVALTVAEKTDRPARTPLTRPAVSKQRAAEKPRSPQRQSAQVVIPDARVAPGPEAMPRASHGTEIFSDPTAAAPLVVIGQSEPAERQRLLGVPLPRALPGYEGLADSLDGARAKLGMLIEDIRD